MGHDGPTTDTLKQFARRPIRSDLYRRTFSRRKNAAGSTDIEVRYGSERNFQAAGLIPC